MRTIVSACIFVGAFAIVWLFTTVPGGPAGGIAGSRLLPAERLWHSAQFDLQRTRDPRTGAIPAGIRSREMAYVATLPESGGASWMRRHNAGAPIVWTQRGPTRVAGRMLDLAFDRDNDNILYAGSASGGFWKSTDRGSSWRKTTPPEFEQTVGCITQDPRPGLRDVLYCGTGELLSTTDRSIAALSRTTGYGNGIYRSSDRGETWQALPSTMTNARGGLQSPFQGIWDLEIANDGWDAGAVYAACHGQVLRSFDDGASWEAVLGDAAALSFSTDVEFTALLSYAAIGGFTVSGGVPSQRGIFLSSDRREWTDITPAGFPGNARVVEMAAAPSDPYLLYVLTETPMSFPIPQLAFTASRHTLWKYTYNPASGSGTWEQRTAALPNGGVGSSANNGYNTLGGYCITMEVHPLDADLLFVGGTNLYRSDNAFATSAGTKIIGGYPYRWVDDELHPDQHAMAFLPSDPNVLFVANDGGVQATMNCTAANVAWAARNNGLVTSQFYRVAQDPTAHGDAFVIGGLQDNATYFALDAGDISDWRGAIGGDGMSVAVAPGKDFVISSVYSGRVYSFVLDESGQADSLILQRDNSLLDIDFAFFTVFALDPVEGNTLYLGGLPALWRKDDLAAAAHDPDLATEGWAEVSVAAFSSDEYVSAIGCAQDASGRVYIGSSGGGIKRIENARGSAPQATALGSPLFPTGGYVSCLAVDPHDPDRVFAVFSNYNVQSLFMSLDAGATWQAVGGNLEEFPDGSGSGPSLRWLAVLPVKDGEWLFAATSSGLFSTTRIDGMQTEWTRESAGGIGAVCVDHVDARVVDGSVVVATQGHGVWSARIESTNAVEAPTPGGGFELLSLWPQPARDRVSVSVRGVAGRDLALTVRDLQGRELLRRSVFSSAAIGTHTMDVSALPRGLYLLVADDGRTTRCTKLLHM